MDTLPRATDSTALDLDDGIRFAILDPGKMIRHVHTKYGVAHVPVLPNGLMNTGVLARERGRLLFRRQLHLLRELAYKRCREAQAEHVRVRRQPARRHTRMPRSQRRATPATSTRTSSSNDPDPEGGDTRSSRAPQIGGVRCG